MDPIHTPPKNGRPDDSVRPSVWYTDGRTDAVAEALQRQAETLAAIQDTVARMAAPPPTPESDQIPLDRLIDAYRDWMAARKLPGGEARGQTKHVKQTRDKLQAWRRAAQWVRFSQITEPSAEAAMNKISAERSGREGHKRIGVQTERHWWQALLSFCNWVAKRYKLGPSPLAGYEKPSVSAEDVRHKRRRLTWDEVGRLIDAATSSGPILTIPGEDRGMLYLAANLSGYRKKELGSLKPENFVFGDEYLQVSLEGRYAKNRRAANQVIGARHVRRFREWIAAKPPGKLLWPVSGEVDGGVDRNTAEMMAKDLATAGIPYRDAKGRYADFHSHRKTYVSVSLENGVLPNVVQKMARHADISMTLNVYDDLIDPQVQAAADAMPDLPPAAVPPEKPDPPRLRLIGTE